ncbi:MFS transporter [Spirochaetia bacterium]|nr:MFS transporter [Spirochaetia bacterium]
MATLLLCVIYLAFISLGLPDSILGSAWPVMRLDFDVPLHFAGLVSAAITLGTVASSLFSSRAVRRLGTGAVVLISVAMTAAGLLGFSLMPHFYWLFIFALPLGLGAGAIDTALNNYVALHYKARHMNWLHCFWGLGAGLSPIIMAGFISRGNRWREAYRAIAAGQWGFVIILAASLFLWKKAAAQQEPAAPDGPAKGLYKADPWSDAFAIPGVKAALLGFFSYVSLESLLNVWGPTYLVMRKGVDAEIAAKWLSLYFVSLTAGRFISGVMSGLLSSKTLIFAGCAFAALGLIFLALPLPLFFSFAAFILLGFGYAPIFPAMLHETPRRFGAIVSQYIMGYQFAVSYIGASFTPILTGMLISRISMTLYPFLFVIFLVLLAGSSAYIAVLEKPPYST